MRNGSENLPLGDLVEQRTDKIAGHKDPNIPYVGLEHMAQGYPVLLGTAPASISVSTNSVFEPDDILFGKLRPNLKKSVQVGFSGYCSTDILVLRTRPGVDPAFAARVLQRETVFDEAVRTAEGTKMPRTSWSKLGRFEVFVPGLAEQRRIAETLDTADEAIQKTEALISKLKQVKTGLTNDLLTRGIDQDGQLRDPVAHPEQFKDSPLGRIPRNWEIVELRRCLTGSPQNGIYKPASAIGSGTLLVGQTSFTESRSVNFQLARRAIVTRAEIEHFGLEKGNLLVSRVFATVEGVGQPVQVPEVPEPSVYESNMMRLRVDGAVIKPEILFHWLRLPDTRRRVVRKCNSSNQTSINQTSLNRIPVATLPMREQQAIASIIASHDDRIRAEEAYRDKLKLLKGGLMEDLLTGRVRVGA